MRRLFTGVCVLKTSSGLIAHRLRQLPVFHPDPVCVPPWSSERVT